MEYFTNEDVNPKFQSRLRKFMNCIAAIKMNYSGDLLAFYFLFLKGKKVIRTMNSAKENKMITIINQFGGKTNPNESLKPIA